MSSNCRTGLTTPTECQIHNVNGSIQRRLSDGSGWRIPPHQRFFLALSIMLSSLLLPSAAQAAIITVNVLTDEVEDTCPATCSIRAALASANPGDEIQFDVNGTIVLTQGELVVDKDLIITGPGAENLALDGNSMSRVLKVNSGVTANIQGLTIQNGRSEDCGGGIYNASGTYNDDGSLMTNSTITNSTISGNSAGYGGGICNGSIATLTLTNSTISGNSADGGGYYDSGGGGIYNDRGSLTVTNSIISGNSAGYGGDYGGLGGGINSWGSLTVTNSTISGNSADYGGDYGSQGGGIYNHGSSLTVTDSTISGNSADYGGGIKGTTSSGGEATLTLTNSTISGNEGGGINHDGRRGYLTAANSTISDNSAGGIDFRVDYGDFIVTNSTISGNAGLGISACSYSSPLLVTNSTISGNQDGGIIEYGCGEGVILARSIITNSPSGANCFGNITSEGDNLSSDSTCIATDPFLNDRNNIDPLLDDRGLWDNGGSTLSIALQPGSPALDGVRHGTCPPPDTDQRGVPRPSGVRCDIGAVEMSADSAPLTVALDIKPGSVKNHINPRGKEKIAVAILSTGSDSDAEPFDATRVDPRSVRFGPKGAKATHRKVKDVNHDGESDLVLYFNNRATGIQCGDTSASMTGETVDGQAIQGSDSIKTVGPHCLDPEALAKLRRLLRYLVSLHGDHGHGYDQGGSTH